MAKVNSDNSVDQKRNVLSALTGLLPRLEHTLFSADGSRSLRTSPLERTKVGANLEFARGLLLRLEQDAQSQKNEKHADLKQKRVQLKKLQDRLYELNQIDDDVSDGGSELDTDDHSNGYGPAIRNTAISAGIEESQSPIAASPSSTNTAAAATLSSALRSRRPGAGSSDDTATATGISSSRPNPNSPTSPFAPKPNEPSSTVSNNETLLTHHSSEQDALTSSLLTLASALKQSTLSFSDSLEASNPLVDRATASLDRNVSGMEAAEKRMGMLRKMTEGKGWWARLGLYGWIAVLWVALILIMFVMPKLRF